MSITSTRRINSTEDRLTLRKLAVRMANLLSALPTKERRMARCELVGQVADGRQDVSVPRSLYPPDSVVGREIERIAVELAGVFRSTLPQEHMSLWGDFAVAMNEHLRMIEFTADWVIREMSAPQE